MRSRCLRPVLETERVPKLMRESLKRAPQQHVLVAWLSALTAVEEVALGSVWLLPIEAEDAHVRLQHGEAELARASKGCEGERRRG